MGDDKKSSRSKTSDKKSSKSIDKKSEKSKSKDKKSDKSTKSSKSKSKDKDAKSDRSKSKDKDTKSAKSGKSGKSGKSSKSKSKEKDSKSSKSKDKSKDKDKKSKKPSTRGSIMGGEEESKNDMNLTMGQTIAQNSLNKTAPLMGDMTSPQNAFARGSFAQSGEGGFMGMPKAPQTCALHGKPLKFYCENTESLSCYDCTVMGPHNTQLHRISNLDEAFRYRFETLNKTIHQSLVPKRASLIG